MCFDLLYIFCWNISQSKKKWERYDWKMYIDLHVKCPFIFSDFKETWNFSTVFRKNYIPKFMKIRLVGAELFHTDGRTDLAKLVVDFRNFAKVPKIVYIKTH